MEEIKDYAKECGNRCRVIRMSRGMSQQELAEKMNVTSQAISKWETNGVSDINHIAKLSAVLGQDITADQFEQDAAVSEVGKEILKIIIDEGGYADFYVFLTKMYGMNKDRISSEVFKLERTGAVVREQFKDFADKNRDGVFITAKGVITYKNAVILHNADLVSRVRTWDQRVQCRYATSFQDIVNRNKTTGLLMKMSPLTTGFRFDYLSHLYNNFFSPFIPHPEEQYILYFDPLIKDIALGENCYTDIITRMMQKTCRKKIDSEMEYAFDDNFDEDVINPEFFDSADEEDQYMDWYEQTGLDEVSFFALKHIKEIINQIPANPIESSQDNIEDNGAVNSNPILTLPFVQSGTYGYHVSEEEENMLSFYRSLDDEKKEKIDEWFSEDEIRKFIEENILPAQTPGEKAVDETLHKLWKANSSTIAYYYSFPADWEENGLAQLIRDKVGVPCYEELSD